MTSMNHMAPVDWCVIIGYLIVSLGIGLFFLKRASGSMEDYFIAGRSLPWWVIGFANCATYSGASAAFVMLIYNDGLVGNFWWWPSWVVWMPLVAVLWARYWRRLGIVTPAEFIEVRYGGTPSKVYRGIFACYSSFIWAPLVTGYMTGWMVKQMHPLLGWDKGEIILACAILVLVYTAVSGLFGIAYNDIFQFSFHMVALIILIPTMISFLGGWDALIGKAVAARGPEFMSPVPSLSSTSLTPVVLLALTVQGFFFAASPTAGEGTTAQKFMAAKSEVHAALGQMLSAFLSLVVRIIPIIIYGIVAAALYPKGTVANGDEIWSQLIIKFAPAGLFGAVIASELAAYMSTADGYMNWGASFMTNDLYRRFIKPDATNRQLAIVGKITTVMIVALSFCVAYYLVDSMMEWFLYINAVMIAFILPLAWLRFFWWRLNIWGEAVGVLLGVPLGYILWFKLGYKDKPFWEAFFVLFGSGWLMILITTLLTKPEKMETLKNFYQRCRPPGFWGPVASQFSNEFNHSIRREIRSGALSCFLGIVFFGSMVVLLNASFAGLKPMIIGSTVVMIISGIAFLKLWLKTEAVGAAVGKASPTESSTVAQAAE